MLTKIVRNTLIFGVILTIITIFSVLFIAPHFINAHTIKKAVIKFSHDIMEKEVSINGDIELAFFPSVHIKAKDVIVKNSPGYSFKNFIKLEELEVSAKLLPLLLRHFVVDKIIIKKPIINLEKINNEANWKTRKSKKEVIEKLEKDKKEIAPDQQIREIFDNKLFDKLELKDATIRYYDDQKLVFSNLDLKIDSASFNRYKIDISSKFNDNKDIDINFQSKFTTKFHNNEIKLSDINAIFKEINKNKKNIISDNLHIEGDIIYDISAQKPYINSNIKVDDLKFKFNENKSYIGNNAGSNSNVNYKLPLNLLKKYNTDFALNIDNLVMYNHKISDISLKLSLHDNNLKINTDIKDIYNGNISQIISLNEKQEIDIEGQLEDFNLKEFTNHSKIKQIKGYINSNWHLKSSGNNSNEIIKNLDGNISTHSDGGILYDVNLDEIIRIRGLNDLLYMLLPSEDKKKNTEYNEFKSDFIVNKGIARTNNTILKTDHINILGKGQVNLTSDNLDLKFTPFIKNKRGEFEEYKLAIKLMGPIKDPKIIIDITKVIQKSVESLGKDLQENLQDNVGKSLNEVLDSIF